VTCIAEGGCWVRPMVTPGALKLGGVTSTGGTTTGNANGNNGGNPGANPGGNPGGGNNTGGNPAGGGANNGGNPGGGNTGGGRRAPPPCFWYDQGQVLDEALTQLYYLSDPIDALTIVWLSGGSTGSESQNFGVSYEVAQVTDLFKGSVKVTAPCTGLKNADCSQTYMVYKGASLASRTSFVSNAVQNQGSEAIHTIVTSVTSTDGTPDASHNLCCMGMNVLNAGKSDSSKVLKSSTGGTSKCSDKDNNGNNKYSQARISAFPTYTQITAEDPWLEMFNAVGGIIALVDSAFLIVLWLANMCQSNKSADVVHDMVLAPPNSAPGVEVQLRS